MGINIQEMENGEQLIEYEIPGFINDQKENVGDKEEDFEVLQVLGAGAFSQVLKVRSKINYGIYALKKVDLSKTDNLQGLYNEAKFLLKLNHPNIVKCYKVFKDKSGKYLFFIMELLDNGDLENFNEGQISHETHASEALIWKIFYSCLLGLKYIHDEDIIHRDIKLNNLFLDEKLNIKIGDFNASACNTKDSAQYYYGSNDEKDYDAIRNHNENAGTPEYKAPEIERNEGYDSRVDVYSMGVSFFLLCYHRNPTFTDVDRSDYYESGLYSDELNDLIRQMLDDDSMSRIESREALKIAKKYYIQKYVKNSSTEAVLRCFYNFENFNNYFCQIINEKNKNCFNSPGKEIGKNIYGLFKALKLNNKDQIDDYLYELRLELVKIGLNVKRDDVEIDPGNMIFHILSNLNSVLNEKPTDKRIERTNLEYKKMSRNYRINAGGEEEFFKERLYLYNKRELSAISRNFFHYIITDIICEKCKDSGRYFSQTYFIPFNVDILSKKKGNNNLNIKMAFDCLLNDKIKINPKKAKCCEKCGEKNELYIKKRFYHTSKNLIIILDRGTARKNETFIEFDETLVLNKNDVERFDNIKYELIGIVEKLKNDKYISFTKQDSQWISSDGIKKNFDEAKKTGTVYALFYYCNDNKLVLESIQSALSNPITSNQNNPVSNETGSFGMITKSNTIQPSNFMGNNNVNNSKYNQPIQNMNGMINNNNPNMIQSSQNTNNFNNNINQISQADLNNFVMFMSHMNFNTKLNPTNPMNNQGNPGNNFMPHNINPVTPVNPMVNQNNQWNVPMNNNMGNMGMNNNMFNLQMNNNMNNMGNMGMNNNMFNLQMNNNMNNMGNMGMNNNINNFGNNGMNINMGNMGNMW